MPSSIPLHSAGSLSLDAAFSIPEGILFKDLAGETVLLNLNTGMYFSLNTVGTRIWALLKAGRALRHICQALEEEFDVQPQQCRADALQLAEQLWAHGLLTPAG